MLTLDVGWLYRLVQLGTGEIALIRSGGSSISGPHRDIQWSSSFITKGILILKCSCIMRRISDRQPHWAFLSFRLPVIAALNQSQKRLQVWIEQGADANPRVPTLLHCCCQSPTPFPTQDLSQVKLLRCLIYTLICKHNEYSPGTEIVTWSRPHSLSFS